jgi:thymidine kinase
MSDTVKQVKKVCKCEHCGNEAEMVVTCKLEDPPEKTAEAPKGAHDHKVKGTGVCSRCGNEADMWIDL